jgi:putative transposase
LVTNQKPSAVAEKEDTLMKKDSVVSLEKRVADQSRSALEQLLQEGARQLLQAAIEHEVGEYIEQHQNLRDEAGMRRVVRNGSLPERDLVTGVGPVRIQQPRVHDRREGQRFTSQILPPFMRRVPSVDALIPALYLKGISTGDFGEALAAILGENAVGLSPTNIVRLKQGWQQEYQEWSRRDLSGKRYVYLWADGIYFKVRLAPERPCMLVLMGTLEDGTKELIAVHDGHRESKESWLEVLRDLKARGLKEGPKLAVGDGALGFWAALEEEFAGTKPQRCWVHKTANVLDKLPKRVQPYAKKMIHEMYLAPTKADAKRAYQAFLKHYGAKYPKACECLRKDEEVLFTFYDFPAEHWAHLRSTNPIESTFATVRHRTRQTKGCGSRLATLTMVFKLAVQAEKHWRRINGYQLITKVIEGAKFVDGELKKAA